MARFFWLLLALLTLVPIGAGGDRLFAADADQYSRNLDGLCLGSSGTDRTILRCDDYQRSVETTCTSIHKNCQYRGENNPTLLRLRDQYSSVLGCSAMGQPCEPAQGPDGQVCDGVEDPAHAIGRVNQAVTWFNRIMATAYGFAPEVAAITDRISQLHHACETDGDIGKAASDASNALADLQDKMLRACVANSPYGEEMDPETICRTKIAERWLADGFNFVLNPANDHSFVYNYGIQPWINRFHHFRDGVNRFRDTINHPFGWGRPPPQPQSDITGIEQDLDKAGALDDPGQTVTISPPPGFNQPHVNPVQPNIGMGSPQVNTPNVGMGTPNVQTPSTITQQPDVGMASPQTPSTVTGTPNAPGPGGILIDVAPKGQTNNLSDLRSKVLNLQQHGNNPNVGQ